MKHVLLLPPESLVASGGQRAVYLHPYDRTKLIKVLKPADQLRRRNSFRGRVSAFFPSARIRLIRKEYSEYLRLMLNKLELDEQLPISHMFGFVLTNLGVGCLTEHVMKPDGSVGETLASKIKSGTLTDGHIDMLNATVGRLYKHGARVGDMTAKNFVFGHRDNGNGNGPEECVLVDGLGDIFAVQVRSIGNLPNRIGLDDSCKRLARKNGLNWVKERRQFAR